ncbi:AsnC family protein [Thermoanaerobacterium thermosaccharolyticum]|uniref:AsnC family protein n=1 Tax=Thermoanaerobacterium thermosaccharolyticum TaxID=1517 RepID=UPI003D2A975B
MGKNFFDKVNIDPNKHIFDSSINDEELKYEKKKNNFLISMLYNAITRFVDYESFLKRGYFFILCNKNGYIIKIISNNELTNYFNKLNFKEGNSLRIEDCGINAVNLSMRYNNLTELGGNDHYCRLFKDWYCTAMPIKDGYYGRVIGYLDVSRIGINNIVYQNTFLKNIVSFIEEKISIKSEKISQIYAGLDDIDVLILSSLLRNGVRKAVLEEMGISEKTLRRRINKLYNLLNVNNDVRLIINAMYLRIISCYGDIL